ncbi:MAG TPA: hypothetical protein VG248_09550 [Caulobacteraceae bacterium]|jgi:hypothetical protein|nr:hypothetical protein [Caulobacteraceae bacterium]
MTNGGMTTTFGTSTLAPRRIGGGGGYIAAGILVLAFAALAALAAAGGGTGAAAVAGLGLAVAAGLLAIGFWVRLFGRIEARLIDIQVALLSQR